MQEKVLSSKKNGMAMMILFILLYAAATALAVIGSIFYCIPMATVGFIWLSLGMDSISWIKGTETPGGPGAYFVR